MKKILVVYYSYEGHTAHVASVITKYFAADTLRIKPIKEMTSTGFGKYFWGGSQVYMKKIPKLEPFDIDFSEYDIIFLGSPIWAWSITPPVKSFMLDGNLVDKDIYFFYTHEGGPGKVEDNFKKIIGVSNRLLGSRGFIPPKDKFELINEEITSWLKSLNLK